MVLSAAGLASQPVGWFSGRTLSSNQSSSTLMGVEVQKRAREQEAELLVNGEPGSRLGDGLTQRLIGSSGPILSPRLKDLLGCYQ
jgi:hypothetical protein